MYKEISRCRICGNEDLVPVLHLGDQYLTGVFPKDKNERVTRGPVELVKCSEDKEGQYCGLLQLRQSYDLNEMYGQNYGYRSGLNQSMVEHLQRKVKKILGMVELSAGDIVLDIGSNDGTSLKSYPHQQIRLMGIDPTAERFREYYPGYIEIVPDFFSSKVFLNKSQGKKAKVITSIAMFYDIEDPLEFMRQIEGVLDINGVWVFEQSYMPTMIEMNAYDTVCHEHLEFYRLKQIKWMMQRAGLKIIGIDFNAVNGGSFEITASKAVSAFPEATKHINRILAEEQERGYATLKPYLDFKDKVFKHRDHLKVFFQKTRLEGRRVIGYGASTKGNVILQFCELSIQDISCILEVNHDKFGSFTPGTYIPIVAEKDARALKPDYMIVLPWHFRDFFIKKEEAYLKSGGKLVMPLPQVEIMEILESRL